jgi:hypothetical protein
MTNAEIAAIYAKTEPRRHECEVRFVAALTSRAHGLLALLVASP